MVEKELTEALEATLESHGAVMYESPWDSMTHDQWLAHQVEWISKGVRAAWDRCWDGDVPISSITVEPITVWVDHGDCESGPEAPVEEHVGWKVSVAAMGITNVLTHREPQNEEEAYEAYVRGDHPDEYTFRTASGNMTLKVQAEIL